METTRSQDISLIPGLTKQAQTSLHRAGITTLADLARKSPEHLIYLKGIGNKTAHRLIRHAKAILANEAILFDSPLLPHSPVEVYFDVESIQVNGFRQEDTRYYLFGWCVRQGQSQTFEYEYELAEQPAQEAETWRRFLARIDTVDGPVFHYSGYEKQTIRNLCNRYGSDPQARRLTERLVDLLPIIKNSVALPLKSYSIKSVAPWLGYRWTGVTQTAQDTMIEYSCWLRTGHRIHLDNILTYNEHDCRAMVVIKDWLGDF